MFSDTIFPKENTLPSNQFQTVVRNWLKDKVSGLVRAKSHDREVVLLFVDGVFSVGYEILPGKINKLVGGDSISSFETKIADFSHQPMPVAAMTLVRIMLEQEMSQTDNILGTDLLPYLGKLHIGKSPIAIELVGKKSVAWIVFPGGGLPVRDAVVFENSKVTCERNLQSFSKLLTEQAYRINFYQSIETDAWIEYCLRYVFGHVAELLLSRYGELTGRIMVTSIVRDMNVNCAAMNLNIAVLGQSINDETLFPSPLSAVEHYKFLFTLIIHHIEVVVGSGLIVMIARQVSGGMTDYYAEIINRYELLPDIFLLSSSTTGRLK